MEFKHIPVMHDECIKYLDIKPDGIYVDGTLGGAGHSSSIAAHLSQDGRLIGIDRDDNAIKAASERLREFGERVCIVKNNFKNINEVLDNLGIDKIDGALLDLGVSSHQLDEASRGFSYMKDAPLDMRMDRSAELSAYEVVNNYAEERLCEIIFKYGEERWAKRVAKFIVDKRAIKPINTTLELVSVINAAIPKGARMTGGNAAKRTFQAIRIEVNGELEILKGAVNDFVSRLKTGGRLLVITFHSLEDRIIKEEFLSLASGCTCPKEFPVCVCGNKPKVKVLTGKPAIASDEELLNNSRSKSAKLRVIEKL
ncbi:MAG: 16S rRNA (cytosine(1402)-N(4))-methyltransferase RsmH [Ruminococcaceae bacterium]|nr:16S rRNA (cytosine(1402)-N(4))-methyltransferase RsmH [Oscillospiraceae bacterium]